jgi:hypothetical protein
MLFRWSRIGQVGSVPVFIFGGFQGEFRLAAAGMVPAGLFAPAARRRARAVPGAAAAPVAQPPPIFGIR